MLAIPFFLFLLLLFLLFLLLLFLLPPFLFFLLLFSFLSCAFLLAQRLLFPSTILRSLRSRNNEVLHFLASPSLSFLYLSFSISIFYLLDFFRVHPSLRLLSRNTLRRRLASPRNELRRRREKKSIFAVRERRFVWRISQRHEVILNRRKRYTVEYREITRETRWDGKGKSGQKSRYKLPGHTTDRKS